MSKDSLVVNLWGVYAVLSRVRTRAGIMLNTKLDLKRSFRVSEKLLSFDRWIKAAEEECLRKFHSFES